MQLLEGEEVLVRRREEVGRDPGNNPVYEHVIETVSNVLVVPGPRTDVDDSYRPDGVEVSWTLHIPKEYTESLRGAEVSVRDGPFSPVVGDPGSYMNANTPGPWNRPVEVSRIEG